MSENFPFDVFLSYSTKDQDVVRAIAERLRKDGLKVWFDEWILKAGDSTPAKIEKGLEHSRVLVLCMSASAFGSDWSQLESGTFRFRDPLNKSRRFIPLRLDNSPIKGSLSQFLYINWLSPNGEDEYAKLLKACRPLAKSTIAKSGVGSGQVADNVTQFDYSGAIRDMAFEPNGKHVLTAGGDWTIRLWNMNTRQSSVVCTGHTGSVWSVGWSSDLRRVVSGGPDKTVRIWDLTTGSCLHVFEGHINSICCVGWGNNGRYALSGSVDTTLRIWDVSIGSCFRVLQGHKDRVTSLACSAAAQHVLSGSVDKSVRLWDIESGRCVFIFDGHSDEVTSVSW